MRRPGCSSKGWTPRPVRAPADSVNPVDSIAAIATPPGSGGLAVIRISGRHALSIADRIFRPGSRSGLAPSAAPSHTVHHGYIHRDGGVIDDDHGLASGKNEPCRPGLIKIDLRNSAGNLTGAIF